MTKDKRLQLSWFQGWGAIKQSAFSRKFPGYCLARPIVAACLSPVMEPVPAQLVTVHFQLWASAMLKAKAIISSLLYPQSLQHLCFKFWLSRTSYWRKGSLLSSSIWSGVKSEAGLRKYGQTHHYLQHRKWPAFQNRHVQITFWLYMAWYSHTSWFHFIKKDGLCV